MKTSIKTQKKLSSNITEKEQIIQEINNSTNEELNKSSKFKLKDKINDIFHTLFFSILKTITIIFKLYGIYLLWICLHYFSAHLYIKFCVPNSLTGFLMSPFMITTPHCQGLRWIVYNAADIINNMWILIGAWIYSMLWIFNTNMNVDPTSL